MILYFLFWFTTFVIFWANVGYPFFILIMGKLYKSKEKYNLKYIPRVSIIVPAHNEEKVIENKISNLVSLDYPKNKMEIIITSDFSTDNTNDIVEECIKKFKNYTIKLHIVKNRQGKTNAQNEAVRIANGEILIMTDANSIFKDNAIKELVKCFSKDVSYVTGKLEYVNKNNNSTSNSENSYWDLDTKVRQIESRIQTITAGNGAIYACKKSEYIYFDPINCHDSSMPLYYALNGKKALANHEAIAYEKAGENNKDEFKRKIRMNRILLKSILPSIKILNIFKYKWFTIFYLGHRTSRYLLWICHLILFLSNILLFKVGLFYGITLSIQIIIYLFALIGIFSDIKLFRFCHYYCMTILAQIIGVFNTLTGRNKPFWEKAESTR